MKEYIFNTDKKYYTKGVIAKTVYWLNQDYSASVREDESHYEITISAKDGGEIQRNIEEHVSQLLADFVLREQIIKETKDIRNILYIKAFANTDDFLEYDDSCI